MPEQDIASLLIEIRAHQESDGQTIQALRLAIEGMNGTPGMKVRLALVEERLSELIKRFDNMMGPSPLAGRVGATPFLPPPPVKATNWETVRDKWLFPVLVSLTVVALGFMFYMVVIHLPANP